MTGPEFKTVSQLAAEDGAAAAKPLFGGCWLHYNGPGSSGFGVKRTAMLLPESAMLMVSPMGCGRSGSVVAERFGFAHRMFYLDLDDRSIASGAYIKRIPEAVGYIAGLGEFKAVIICMTCIDALTGTDLAGLGKKISRETGIPVTTTFMDPIVRDGAFGPMVQVRMALTDCFEGGEEVPDAINLLGAFAPLSQGCELYPVLADAGISRILTVAGCSTFQQVREMGRSRFNLLIHPQSAACGEALKKRLGMPFVRSLTSYCPKQILSGYTELGGSLGSVLRTDVYMEKALRELERFSADFAGMSVAVGEAVCGSPFDIAALLTGAGLRVPFLFRDMVQPSDRDAVLRLSGAAPDIPVYSGVHPGTFTGSGGLPRADMALGLDAGYFLPDAVSAAWPFEETHFGFDALISLLGLLRRSFEAPVSHREQMQGSYLTV